jgi:hypothetical protein
MAAKLHKLSQEAAHVSGKLNANAQKFLAVVNAA